MIDQFDWHRYTRSRASRATTAESAAALRGATQRSSARQSSAGRLARSASIFMGRHVLLIVFALLILFPIGGVVAGYMARPKADSAEQASVGVIGTTPDSSDKTKPAPGRPFLAQSQEPPPVVMHHPPTATLEQQEAHSMQIPGRSRRLPHYPGQRLPPRRQRCLHLRRTSHTRRPSTQPGTIRSSGKVVPANSRWTPQAWRSGAPTTPAAACGWPWAISRQLTETVSGSRPARSTTSRLPGWVKAMRSSCFRNG